MRNPAVHLHKRARCRVKHCVAPALAEFADAVAHLMAPLALAFVVLGRDQGYVGREGGTLDVSRM